MGFLGKTVFAKRLNAISILTLAIFASVFCGFIAANNSAFAAEVVDNYGLYTAPDGVRWEWEVVSDSEDTNEPQKLNLMFYDKPENLTTVTVPSYNDMITITGVAPASDTYYVRSANQESQDTRFVSPDPARRTGGADVTVLDMTNTSKVQILGVEPIINPDVETELIFGENMVIGDAMYIQSTYISFSWCTEWRKEDWFTDSDGRTYSYCSRSEGVYLSPSDIAGWEDMTLEEKVNYKLNVEDYGYVYLGRSRIYDDEFDPNVKYVTYTPNYYINTQVGINKGAFSGYKLKLTNFNEFNYIGWHAFYNSTFSEDSTTITISGDTLLGEEIFAKTNVKKVIFNATRTGRGTFKDCAQLTEIEFGDSVETIDSDVFRNTNLGTLDLSTTNIKKVKYGAFGNTKLTSINLGNIEDIGTDAFQDNPGLTEVYLPKSINRLGYSIFDNCNNIKKVTVAYDTLTSGTTVYFTQAFNSRDGDGNGRSRYIEDLTVLAPYEEDEPLKPTHVTYDDYKSHFDSNGNWTDLRQERDGGDNYGSSGNSGYPRNDYQQSEVDYAHVDTYKNVIAPNYFELMEGLKKVTIGEGMEFVGVKAFYTWGSKDYPSFSYNEWKNVLETGKAANSLRQWELSLPDSIKGIGNLAFTGLGGKDLDVNLPVGLEYIGIGAFRGSMGLKGDFDLPNLIFLGDEAFMNTQIRDVVIHDTLQYFGRQVFGGCPFIRNVTIDYDIFNPEKNAFHDTTRKSFNGEIYYGFYDKLWNNFGINDDLRGYTEEEAAEIGIDSGTMLVDGSLKKKYGTIKFTEKAVANYPEVLYAGSGSDAHGNYFASVVADKIDLSECGWTVIPPYFFSAATIGEILLPHNLETIMSNAFNTANTSEELVLPDSIKKIDYAAFNQVSLATKGLETLTITKLPSSLEEIGSAAFYYDLNLAIDFDSANIKMINAAAFMKTSVRDVTIRDGVENLISGAFEYIPTLRNITLDCDYYGINGTYSFYGIFSTTEREKSSQMQGTDRSILNDVVFTDKNITNPKGADFLGFDFNSINISNTKWDKIADAMFMRATVVEPVTMPDGIKKVGRGAFQEARLELVNAFAEGLEALGEGVFYATQVTGDITIPSSVTSIGWSAFNANEADTHFGTVTIKPALDYEKTNNQAIFQMFWNASMDKLVIESPMLPVLGTLQAEPVLPDDKIVDLTSNYTNVVTVMIPELRADGEPEFHGMTMREVEIKNLPAITANAFEECANLESVSFADHTNLEEIAQYAFNNDTKLKHFTFGDGLVNKDVALKEYAFNNTAVETIGTTNNTDFNLAAANFNTVQEHVFSNMPKLKSVDIPNNFNVDPAMADAEKNVNGAHITSFTFSDDPELEQVTVAYQVAEIRDGAFLNDEKLSKLFVWGNAEIQESDDLIRDFNNTTIPKGTTIFGYSDAPAEAYANAESKNDYDGKFYALDEVLYLTSNKSKVLLNEDKTDFDKTGLKLYGLRRDGVILESDWQNYNTAFKRTETPEGTNISFEEGRGALGPDDAAIAATVFDAPKPFSTISLANQNFANVDYEFLSMPSSDNPLIVVHYPDGYTGNIRNTTLISMTIEDIIEEITPDPEPAKPEPAKPEPEPEDELEVPDTGSYGALIGAATSSVSIATIIVLGGIFIAKRRKN